MLRRKFTDYLKQWKATKKNECLLVRGARQIGKTFIIEDFARNNYESFVEINFEQYPALKSLWRCHRQRAAQADQHGTEYTCI